MARGRRANLAKLQDYEFKGLPQDVIDHKDDINEIINFGTYQFPLINSSTAPTHSAGEVQLCFIRNGTAGTMYGFIGSSWNVMLIFTADAS